MQILSKLEDPNTLVALTGGEPTMRDDLVDILKYCKSRMFVTNIQTNAFKFADIEYVKALEPYLDTVFIPIHSHDMTIFDTTTAVPGSGQKIMQAIDNLINSKIILTTNTVINQHNYKTLEKTLDMIQELNPGEVMVLTALHPVGAARTTKVTPRLSDMKPYLATLARKYGYLLHTHYLPRCMFAPFHTLVANIVDDSDQNSKPGVDYIQGTWNKDMNYGKMEGTNKLKAESCRSCIFDNECIGVWREYGELYPDFAEELKPILR
jgi:MoaA/NifB/PqqE/SkfB family radical SAM enzyme